MSASLLPVFDQEKSDYIVHKGVRWYWKLNGDGDSSMSIEGFQRKKKTRGLLSYSTPHFIACWELTKTDLDAALGKDMSWLYDIGGKTKKTTRLFAGFSNHHEFFTYMTTSIHLPYRSFFEVIDGRQGYKFCLDLDYILKQPLQSMNEDERKEVEQLEERAIEAIVDATIAMFNALLEVNISVEKNILPFTSNVDSEVKRSYHLVVTKYSFTSDKELKCIANEVIKEVMNSPILDGLKDKYLKYMDKEPYQWVDPFYKRMFQFRFFGCCKAGTIRRKRLLSSIHYMGMRRSYQIETDNRVVDHLDDRVREQMMIAAVYRDSLIGYTVGCDHLSIDLEEEKPITREYISHSIKMINKINNTPAAIEELTKAGDKILQMLGDRVEQEKKNAPSPLDPRYLTQKQLRTVLQAFVNVFDSQGKKYNEDVSNTYSFDSVNNMSILLKRARASFCLVCKRYHEGDNAYITCSKLGDVLIARFHCFRAHDAPHLIHGLKDHIEVRIVDMKVDVVDDDETAEDDEVRNQSGRSSTVLSGGIVIPSFLSQTLTNNTSHNDTPSNASIYTPPNHNASANASMRPSMQTTSHPYNNPSTVQSRPTTQSVQKKYTPTLPMPPTFAPRKDLGSISDLNVSSYEKKQVVRRSSAVIKTINYHKEHDK